MDAWSHLVFAFVFAILSDVYTGDKVKRLMAIAIGIEILNAIIAIFEYDYYNALGVVLRGPFLGYLVYERSQTTSEDEKAQLEQLIALLFSAVYLAAASHNLDLVIDWSGYDVVQLSIYRGHNIWHTPLASLLISLEFVIIIYLLSEWFSRRNSEFKLYSSFNLLYLATVVGYISHILADFLVYNFPIYWFYPSDLAFLGINDFIGNGVLTKAGTSEKPEGTTYFWATPFFVIIFLFVAVSKLMFVSLRAEQKESIT